jgi:hypothetical protein
LTASGFLIQPYSEFRNPYLSFVICHALRPGNRNNEYGDWNKKSRTLKSWRMLPMLGKFSVLAG